MKLMLSISMLLSALVGAAQAQPPTTLTLESAVNLAIEKNTGVIQARNTMEGRQTSVQAAMGSLFPTLEAFGSYSNQRNWTPGSGGGTVYYQGIPVPIPTSGGFSLRENYSTGLDSRVVLFNGFANLSNVTRAKADASSSEYTVTRTEQSTIIQTHSLFLNVVRTYEL